MARRDDHIMLMRIIAILFSFAVMAERLIGAPSIVRRLVLYLLRAAETVARGLLAGEAGTRGLRGLPSRKRFDGFGPEDALHLARCFRALALALRTVVGQSTVSGASPAPIHKPLDQRCRLAPRPLPFINASVLDTC